MDDVLPRIGLGEQLADIDAESIGNPVRGVD